MKPQEEESSGEESSGEEESGEEEEGAKVSGLQTTAHSCCIIAHSRRQIDSRII